MKMLPVLVASAIIITEVLATIASTMFFYRNITTDIEHCLYALFQIVALVTVIYMWFVAYNLRSEFIQLFARFQQIYDTSNVSFNC